ncbi:hypothetical protein LIA77_01644 [Sarocladium implicatum]|nr:hypothetical protein LIA77_01644 [Sarocladium implicatum]
MVAPPCTRRPRSVPVNEACYRTCPDFVTTVEVGRGTKVKVVAQAFSQRRAPRDDMRLRVTGRQQLQSRPEVFHLNIGRQIVVVRMCLRQDPLDLTNTHESHRYLVHAHVLASTVRSCSEFLYPFANFVVPPDRTSHRPRTGKQPKSCIPGGRGARRCAF